MCLLAAALLLMMPLGPRLRLPQRRSRSVPGLAVNFLQLRLAFVGIVGGPPVAVTDPMAGHSAAARRVVCCFGVLRLLSDLFLNRHKILCSFGVLSALNLSLLGRIGDTKISRKEARPKTENVHRSRCGKTRTRKKARE
jgi:hypothetical protein